MAKKAPKEKKKSGSGGEVITVTPAQAAKMGLSPVPQAIRKKLFRLWTIWLIATLVGSLLPGALTPEGYNYYLIHLANYAFLAFLPVLILPWPKGGYAAMDVFLLSGLIEWVQMYIPGRSADLMDLLANAVGVGLGLSVALVLRNAVDSRLHQDESSAEPTPVDPDQAEQDQPPGQPTAAEAATAGRADLGDGR